MGSTPTCCQTNDNEFGLDFTDSSGNKISMKSHSCQTDFRL